MRTRDGLVGLLSFVLILAIGAPALAASPGSERPPEEAFRFSLGGQLISLEETTATPAESDRQWMALVEKELNAAKQELLELEGVRQAALILYSDPDEVCEREVIERWYDEERARLKSNVSALRGFRGDRRGFFTKAWHKIGPVGRRIVRAIGDEALVTLKSGGTLGGGVARRILIRVGRKELKNVVLAGIARKIQTRAAAAKGAAEAECKTDDPGAKETEPAATGLPPAIPAGRYVGAFDEALLKQTEFVDNASIEVNVFELVVADDGSVSGDWEIHQTGEMSSANGSASGCAGAAGNAVGTLDPGQRIGPTLPQSVTMTVGFSLLDTVGYYSDPEEPEVQAYCTGPEPYDLGTEPAEFVVRHFAGGVVSGEFPDWVPFELERVE